MDSDIRVQVVLEMLVQSLGFRDAAAVVQQKISRTFSPVVDGKGGCYCCMLCSRDSTACKFFANESVVVPLPLPAHETVTAV